MSVEIYSPTPKKRILKIRTFSGDELDADIAWSYRKFASITCIVNDEGVKISGGLLYGLTLSGKLVRFSDVPASIARDAGIALTAGKIQDIDECEADYAS